MLAGGVDDGSRRGSCLLRKGDEAENRWFGTIQPFCGGADANLDFCHVDASFVRCVVFAATLSATDKP